MPLAQAWLGSVPDGNGAHSACPWTVGIASGHGNLEACIDKLALRSLLLCILLGHLDDYRAECVANEFLGRKARKLRERSIRVNDRARMESLSKHPESHKRMSPQANKQQEQTLKKQVQTNLLGYCTEGDGMLKVHCILRITVIR
jgi:hypothetical protein